LHNAVLEYCPGLESFIFKFTSQEHDSMFLWHNIFSPLVLTIPWR
jgi:hypothetical protein